VSSPLDPDYKWFADLGLKWYAVPVISNMRLEIGGISYTAAPFNGWYMGTEVGTRNLGDVKRYNLLPVIAQKMGLEMHSDRTLWKDRALIELNVAVLHSFAQQGVTMVDHHTASRQFVLHEDLEKRAGRTTPADWGGLCHPFLLQPLRSSTRPMTITSSLRTCFIRMSPGCNRSSRGAKAIQNMSHPEFVKG
jgi:nitric-oxide synthase